MSKWLKRLLPVVLVALAVVLGVAVPAQGKEVYVAVQSGHGDAVIFAKPDLNSDVIGFLETNQKLDVLDETNKSFYQVKAPDGTTGWVARNVVRNEMVKTEDASSSASTGSSGKSLAAMGFSAEIEGKLAEDDPKFGQNLATVRELEYTVRGELTGVWQRVIPMEKNTHLTPEQAKQVTSNRRKAYVDFGQAGGLAGSNP